MQSCLDRSNNAEREEKLEICVEIVRFLRGTLGTEMRVESPANPHLVFIRGVISDSSHYIRRIPRIWSLDIDYLCRFSSEMLLFFSLIARHYPWTVLNLLVNHYKIEHCLDRIWQYPFNWVYFLLILLSNSCAKCNVVTHLCCSIYKLISSRTEGFISTSTRRPVNTGELRFCHYWIRILATPPLSWASKK